MRIGIDIDDTLVNTSKSFNNVLKKYNIDFKKKFNDRRAQEEIDSVLKKYSKEILIGAEFKEYSKEVINYLSNLGHELFILTARNDFYSSDIPELTRKIIQDNFNITNFYFNQSKKSDIAKKLKLDLMIDDSIEVYNNMKEENIDCILFGDKIKTWDQVLNYIMDKEERDG